jgi:hypothetical protein
MKNWLRYLWENEDGFFGLGQGPSSQETQQYGDTANLANFATSEGESAIGSANTFWQSILSGDPSQISKVLGPLMSTVNKQGQEQKQTLSQFGNRSGGTNATAQTIGDTTRSTIDSAVSSLTGGAASALGASGSSLLSTGLSAHTAAFDSANTIHQQRAAQINDLFKSIAATAAPLAALIPGPAGQIVSKSLSNLGSQSDSSSGGGGGGGGWNPDWGANPDSGGGGGFDSSGTGGGDD